jgi:rare lipoprotein A
LARTARSSALLLVALALAACGTTRRATTTPSPTEQREPRGKLQRGKASWYGGRFQGRLTASGERFDQDELTAAHRTLPFHSRVRVTNLENGRSVEVRINDRGPYGPGRIIDLSRAAARVIGMIERGVVPVTVEILASPR